MVLIGDPPEVYGSGEYGATTIHVTRDGSMLRIAFGRNGPAGEKLIYGAVLLSPEAEAQLREQLAALPNVT